MITKSLFLCSALALACVTSVCITSAVADTSAGPADEALEKQRALFKDARYALRKGQRSRFERNRDALPGYPLYHYLNYEALRAELRQTRPDASSIAAVTRFQQASDDPVLTGLLTYTLQDRFVDTGQWSLFLQTSESDYARNLPCSTLRARFETGQVEVFDEAAVDLWVQPVRHPRLCRSVLDEMEKRGAPPLTAIWEKIFTAIDADREEIAQNQMHYLGTRDRSWVRDWLKAREKPKQFLLSGALARDTLLNRRMLADLVELWSRTEPEEAMAHWLEQSPNYVFFDDRYYDTSRALAMRGAYRRLPDAYDWLASFDAREDDLELMEWRVRAALFNRDWAAVLSSIERLPEIEQQEDHWAYWVGRALEQTGRPDEANAIYTELAGLQSYHGFLSADRLELPYAIENVPIEPESGLLERLAEDPQLVRAREYQAVGLTSASRRDWRAAMERQTQPELAASAVLAKRWNLHDRAIFSAGRAEERQALELRFPVLYEDAVRDQASANRIDPAWVFGVMRRESAYIADVRSYAGAIGLMQLMPATARHVAKMKGRKSKRFDLTDASTNIAFGTFYLRHVLDEFDDHMVMATASYNAGPSRVRKWLADSSMPADVWVDTIPFTETRRYVRAVLAYTSIYEWHLDGEAQRLSTKFRDIPAATGT